MRTFCVRWTSVITLNLPTFVTRPFQRQVQADTGVALLHVIKA